MTKIPGKKNYVFLNSLCVGCGRQKIHGCVCEYAGRLHAACTLLCYTFKAVKKARASLLLGGKAATARKYNFLSLILIDLSA